MVIALGILGALGQAFCGTALPGIQTPDMEGCVTMGVRARLWTGGRPNFAMQLGAPFTSLVI